MEIAGKGHVGHADPAGSTGSLSPLSVGVALPPRAIIVHMPPPRYDRRALERGQAARPAQATDLKATLPLHANRADQAGLVIQDIARSSLRKLIQRVRIQCHRVITAATLKLLDTKYKAHLRKCRRDGPAHLA